MNTKARYPEQPAEPAATDLLILSDGTVLAHNLTPAMAAVLHKLNPQDETMRLRSLAAPDRPALCKAGPSACAPS